MLCNSLEQTQSSKAKSYNTDNISQDKLEALILEKET